MNNCGTEFLPLFFHKFSLLVIGCYHPFWNDIVEHEAAIECISCIIDYAAVNLPYESFFRILLIGDFNDLYKSYDVISGAMNLKHIITFHTRNDKVLDQLFTNFHNTVVTIHLLSLPLSVALTIAVFCAILFLAFLIFGK